MNYTNLFNRLRVLTSAFFDLEYHQQQTAEARRPLPYLRDMVLAPFEAQDVPVQASTFSASISTALSGLTGAKQALQMSFSSVWDSVLGELRVPSRSILFRSLDLNMKDESESLRKRHLEIPVANIEADGTLEAHEDNAGDGVLVYTFAEKEIAIEDQLQCICTSSIGERYVFSISGGPAVSSTGSVVQGAGSSNALSPLYETEITNGTFETWSGDPEGADDWTLLSGAWETNAKKSDVSFAGTYALEITSTAAASQAYQIVSLTPGNVYAFGCWVRKATGATGNVYIEVIDESNVQQVTEELNIVLGDLAAPDTWYFKFFTFVAPPNATATWRLSIRTASQAAASVFLDNLQFGEMSAFNNMYFALFSGSVAFSEGDRFACTIQVTPAGDAYTVDDGDQETIELSEHVDDEFPVGASIQNSTDKTWHRITSSEWADDKTIIVVTPKAFTPWTGLSVQAFHHGRIQELIGRLFGEQLPSSDTPTREDP